MIELKNVTKRYYTLTALNQVSLQVRPGEVLGVLGPNGAGKTTLFKLMAGFLQPDAGSITPISGNWPAIGYKPERLLYPNKMRVSDYLRLMAGVCNIPHANAERTIQRSLEQVNLLGAANKRIKDCSKGMRQRLGLAQALIGDPPLLLLDEPSNGLDPEGQQDIQNHIRALRDSGKTIVLSSHQLHEVTAVCSHLIILNQGQIHYENSMAGALTEKPHAIIRTTQELTPLRPLLQSLHADIEVDGTQVVLNNDAIRMRRHVMSILLGIGYDIVQVDQRRVTLAEIYAEAVQ